MTSYAPSCASPAPPRDGCFLAVCWAGGRQRELSCSARWPSSGHGTRAPRPAVRGAGRHEGPVRKTVD